MAVIGIGKRIRQYREKAKLCQEELAYQVGLIVVSISHIERGRNYPKMEIFIKIANVLKVSPNDLLCDVCEVIETSAVSDLIIDSEKYKKASPKARMLMKQICNDIFEADIN